MKNKIHLLICVLISLFILNSCNEKAKLMKPQFLIGSWERVNDESGNLTFENWNSNFTGIGYTLKDSDTIFKEELSIIELNDTLFLKVTGVNEEPTLFKFTNQTNISFTCENKLNEFPKEVSYRLENDSLKASVSNEEFSIEFVFKRVNSNN